MNVKKDTGFDFSTASDEASKIETPIEQKDVVSPSEKREETPRSEEPTKPEDIVKPEAVVGAAEDPTSAQPRPVITYTQEQWDANQARVTQNEEALKKRAKDAEDQLKEKKAKLEEVYANQRKTDDLIKNAYILLGDGSPAKIHALVMELVKLQRAVDEVKECQKKYEDLKKTSELTQKWYTETSEKYCKLVDEHRALQKETGELEDRFNKLAEREALVCQQLESMKTIGDRMIGAFVPECLANKEWFVALLSDLQDEVYKDPPSDSAILLFASIAEFAVMERGPADACFEWKKQLSDIGLVVAKYMHEKKATEGDVVKMLRNFAMALRESQTVAKLKISLKVPELGSDFNVDEVKHLKNGSAVALIRNWCIIDSNGVYSKAIVE